MWGHPNPQNRAGALKSSHYGDCDYYNDHDDHDDYDDYDNYENYDDHDIPK